MQTQKSKVSEEVALDELQKFLQKYKRRELRKGDLNSDKLKEMYPDVIEAIQDGYLVFNEKSHPTYTLRYPMEVPSGNEDLATREVTFRSRIKPSEKASIMDGLNIQTQQARYALRYVSFVTGLSAGDIDNLDTEDWDTINQVSSVF